jgi:hypothetical protein
VVELEGKKMVEKKKKDKKRGEKPEQNQLYKRQRTKKDKACEMVTRQQIDEVYHLLLNEDSRLDPPPPHACIEDIAEGVYPANASDMWVRGYECRSMFVFEHGQYIVLNRDWWGSLLGLAMSGYLENTVSKSLFTLLHLPITNVYLIIYL